MATLMLDASKRGAVVVDRGHGHIQIRGQLLVNYYPFSKKRTAYVAGTFGGKMHVTPAQAVAMAYDPPPLAAHKERDRRRAKSKRKRAAMLRAGMTECHWCHAPLTVDNSTIEHKIPLARGGLDNANNRVLACAACNHGRGHDMPELKQ